MKGKKRRRKEERGGDSERGRETGRKGEIKKRGRKGVSAFKVNFGEWGSKI